MSFKYLFGRVKNLYLLYYVSFFKGLYRVGKWVFPVCIKQLSISLKLVRSGLPVGRLGSRARAACYSEGIYFLGWTFSLVQGVEHGFSYSTQSVMKKVWMFLSCSAFVDVGPPSTFDASQTAREDFLAPHCCFVFL